MCALSISISLILPMGVVMMVPLPHRDALIPGGNDRDVELVDDRCCQFVPPTTLCKDDKSLIVCEQVALGVQGYVERLTREVVRAPSLKVACGRFGEVLRGSISPDDPGQFLFMLFIEYLEFLQVRSILNLLVDPYSKVEHPDVI